MKNKENPERAMFRLARIVSVETGHTVGMYIYRADKVGGGVPVADLMGVRKDLVGSEGVVRHVYVLPSDTIVRRVVEKNGWWEQAGIVIN